MSILRSSLAAFILINFLSCTADKLDQQGFDLTSIIYNPKTYNLDYPSNLGQPIIPEDNKLTVEGVYLGKKLFYDPILSVDSTKSCASCHLPSFSFNDNKAFSEGVNQKKSLRSSMPLINLAFTKNGFFWDGRAESLEDQALHPVEDPNELNHKWVDVENSIRKHKHYPALFRKAFGISNSSEINRQHITKAIAQFERTIISGNSKFDKILRGEEFFTDLELYGFTMFVDNDPNVKDAECGHCHSIPLGTADQFFNNGLTEAPNMTEFKDFGRGQITGNLIDRGKFKAPTLRNVTLTAPYMHDGRFNTLDEVLDHYSSGGKSSPNKDPLLYPLNFTSFEKRALKAFIETLVDTNFMKDPKFLPE
jgi:cytochrome c peroxidase